MCHLVLLCPFQLACVIVCGRYWRLPVLMAVWCIFVFCTVVYIQILLLNTEFENDIAVPTDWEGQKVLMKGTYLQTFPCLEWELCCSHTCTWPCTLNYELGSLTWPTLPCLDALDCWSVLLVPFKSCRTAPCQWDVPPACLFLLSAPGSLLLYCSPTHGPGAWLQLSALLLNLVLGWACFGVSACHCTLSKQTRSLRACLGTL